MRLRIMVGENMKEIHISLKQTPVVEEPLTACIGYFDGLHLGHQKLIEEVKQVAEKRNTRSALITFEPDPWGVIKGLREIAHITPMKQRMRIAEAMGIEYWIILDFSKEMADLTPQDFHERVLKPLHLDTLVCGYDFHYGRKGEGDARQLQSQQDFEVHIIDEVSSEHKKISSTRIEELIKEGSMEKAARFMGRWYDMEGSVKGGSRVGRKHGFPTANLHLFELYVMPKKGVYVGAVKVQGTWHKAMINVGNNPTYNYQEQLSIEAHLLDFDRDIYDEPVTFRFLSYIREEQKFHDADALHEQLKKDLAATHSYFMEGKESALCD